MKALKGIAMLLVAVSFVFAASGCRGDSTLTVGVDVSQIPLSYRDEQNNISGFFIDMASEAAKRAGVTVKFVPVNWPERQSALGSGNVNCLWGEIGVEDTLKQSQLFTKAYMRDNVVIVVPSSSVVLTSDDLKGKAVGVIKGSDAANALLGGTLVSSLADGAPLYYSNNNTLFSALGSGQLDAVAANETTGGYYINQNTLDYKVLPGNLASSEYVVAFRRNDSRLRNSIEKSLESMYGDGTSKTLSKKWFGGDFTVKPR